MKVSVASNSNIALTKYWGRRDARVGIPFNSSTSVTLEGMETRTTVEFDKKYDKDIFILDGKEFASGTGELKEMQQQLNYIRDRAKTTAHAKVVSNNSFPTAAGFASSASGNSALAFAAAKALGLKLGTRELSKLTKMVSGSAARSLVSGFAIWHRGVKANGEDCFVEQIADEKHWPEFRLLACVISRKQKKVSSRAGMAQSVATSPMFEAWYTTAEKDAQKMVRLIKDKNFPELGKLAQRNCLLLHSCMMTTTPAIIYWEPGTIEVMHKIIELQESGKEVYFTMDAGPQTKILCLEKDVAEVKKILEGLGVVQEIFVCKPGPGTREIKEHLF